MKLLTDGKEAFPEIIRCIRKAEKTILIHMFIWRNDRIGRRIAREVLAAADRGVKVLIEKDLYGSWLEYAEETQRSLMHRPPRVDLPCVSTLIALYNRDLFFRPLNDTRGSLYQRLTEHPRITVRDRRKTYDHAKYFVFDGRILILGGINIEDKENGADRQGRFYHDYMVKISEPSLVRVFMTKRKDPLMEVPLYRVNRKLPCRRFEIKDAFLALIDGADELLFIMMAYFAPDKEILSALKRAADRGVRIRVLLPSRANYADDLNKRTAHILLRMGGQNIRVFLTPKMLHAKLLMSEKQITVGSCNINRKAFTQLDELNILTANDDSTFARSVRRSVKQRFEEACEIPSSGGAKYRMIPAVFEMLFI